VVFRDGNHYLRWAERDAVELILLSAKAPRAPSPQKRKKRTKRNTIHVSFQLAINPIQLAVNRKSSIFEEGNYLISNPTEQLEFESRTPSCDICLICTLLPHRFNLGSIILGPQVLEGFPRAC